MIPKKWRLFETDRTLLNNIKNQFDISEYIISVLFNRGITTEQDIKSFLNPSIFDISNPFLLTDMDKAVKRIRKAIDTGEIILIYGDGDVDGITSVSILMNTLRTFKLNPLQFIPTYEGYGLSKASIEKIINMKPRPSLIITVDCGISDIEEVEFIKQHGIDVIITDHHQPPAELPKAYAVINPKRDEDKIFSDIAGCTVAFKLALALMMSFDKYYDKEIVAIDIETTGLHPQIDEICEIAAIKTKNFVINEKFHSLVKPKNGIPKHVSRIHGITDETCRNAPEIKEILPKFIEFINNALILVHNADFDISFLQYNLKRYLNVDIHNQIIDTLTMSRDFFPFKSHSLGALAENLKFGTQQHRALDDATLCFNLFQRMLMLKNTKIRFFIEDHLDMVSIGTIADIMPLISENRVLTKYGLDSLRRTRKIGLGILVDRYYKKQINARDVAFDIAPLLNACGRYKVPEIALNLLTVTDLDEGEKIFQIVNEINEKRKEKQTKIMEIFEKLVDSQCDIEKDKLLFVVAENLERGVTGIVASHLLKRYNRPIILLISDGEVANGVGRAQPGFDLYSAISECSEVLLRYGGHAQSVGITVSIDRLSEFKNKLLKIVDDMIRPEDLIPTINIDAEIEFETLLSKKFLREISMLEPFGYGNSYPVFLIRDIKINNYETIGSRADALRVVLSKNSKMLSAVVFDIDIIKNIRTQNLNSKFDIVVQIGTEIWNEKECPRIEILDMKLTETTEDTE